MTEETDDLDNRLSGHEADCAKRYAALLARMGRLDLDIDGDGDVDSNDIRAMTPEMATPVCRQHLWRLMRCDLLSAPLATLVFD